MTRGISLVDWLEASNAPTRAGFTKLLWATKGLTAAISHNRAHNDDHPHPGEDLLNPVYVILSNIYEL